MRIILSICRSRDQSNKTCFNVKLEKVVFIFQLQLCKALCSLRFKCLK